MLSYNANGFYNSFDPCYEFLRRITLKTSYWDIEVWISFEKLNETMLWRLQENQLFL